MVGRCKGWIFILLISVASSATALTLTDEVQDLLPYASIYVESARPLSEAQLRRDSAVEFFRPVQDDSLRTGPDAHPIWLNFILETQANLHRTIFIDSPYMHVNQVVDLNGELTVTFDKRTISLTIPPGKHEIFVRLVPSAPTTLSLTIAAPELALKERLQAGGIQAIMAGVLLTMMFFSIWYAARQRSGLLLSAGVYFFLQLIFFGAIWPFAVATVTPSQPDVGAAFVLAMASIFWMMTSFTVRDSLPDWYWRMAKVVGSCLLATLPLLMWLDASRLVYTTLLAIVSPLAIGTALFGYRGQAPGLSALIASGLALAVWLILWRFEQRGQSLATDNPVPIFCTVIMLHAVLLYHGIFSFSRGKRSKPLAVAQSGPLLTTKLLKDISHTLNNRINGLTGTMDMLAQTGVASQHAEWFGTIDLSVLQLESLCDELNTITLLQDRGTNDSRQRLLGDSQFDVFELMESAVDPFRQVAARLGVELIADLEQVTHSTRIGPVEAIRRCLKIILGRAIDASAPDDEIILTVIAMNDRDCRFRIQARGMTMSASDIQSLLHANHEHPRALGLQLAIHLAKQFNCEMRVTNDAPGVSFVLPVILDQPLDRPVIKEPAGWQLPTGMRVLVVDDSLTCRRTLQPMLQQLRLRVEVADNIQTALATIENQYHMDDPFEIILCDHQLGNYPGLQLVREITEGDEPWQKRLLMVLMSGTPKFELPDEYRQLGVKHVVEKPVFMHSLRRTLEQAYGDYLRGDS